MISPKSNNKKVRIIVSKTKPNTGTAEKSIHMFIAYVQSITTATFTKLFVINIAAKRYSERSNKRWMIESEDDFPSLISLKSLGEREKKATSEADIKPEIHNNNAATTKAIIGPVVNPFMITCSNKLEK